MKRLIKIKQRAGLENKKCKKDALGQSATGNVISAFRQNFTHGSRDICNTQSH